MATTLIQILNPCRWKEVLLLWNPKIPRQLEKEMVFQPMKSKHSLLTKMALILSILGIIVEIIKFIQGKVLQLNGILNIILYLVLFIIILIHIRRKPKWNKASVYFTDFVITGFWIYFVLAGSDSLYAPRPDSTKSGAFVDGMNSIVITFVLLKVVQNNYSRFIVIGFYLGFIVHKQEYRESDYFFFLMTNLCILALFIAFDIFFQNKSLQRTGNLFSEVESIANIHRNLHDGIAIFGAEGKLLFSNQSFNMLLNSENVLSLDQMITSFERSITITRRIRADDTPKLGPTMIFEERQPDADEEVVSAEEFSISCQKLKRSLKNDVKQQPTFFELKVQRHRRENNESSSTVAILELKVSPLFYNNQESLLLSLADVTHSRELARIKGLDEYKDLLLASVTHELRTPLNCIIPMLNEAVASTQVPQEISDELLLPALNSGRLLLSLVNDILDYSKLKRQRLTLNFEKFDVREKMRSILELFEFQALQKNLKIELEVSNDIPQFFTSEPNRLGQIIINFLSNAFKFTREGFVTLKVKRKTSDRLSISVSDTGIGIRSDDQAKLFQIFGKLEAAEYTRLNNMGAGLGLAISNQLVKLLGGDRIRVESEYGKGSTFTFDIHNQATRASFIIPEVTKPFEEIESPKELELVEPNLEKTPCNCRRILLVDDNEFNLKTLTRLIKSIDSFECVYAYDGEEALSYLKDSLTRYKSCSEKFCQRFQIIISDLSMPIMNGFDLLQEYKKLSKSKSESFCIPFVICTAFDTEAEIVRGFNLGMDDYLPKPMNPAQLKTILQKFGVIAKALN